ncbi:MarR family winged helix-turn-helix transcriptional regulator [Streptococcus tangpeifui]|uniref:MarR family winged helix-turn-helix transcriptional regulator n=1 Tax=Streptococcus tangpeifui TaxID=2709400 RepID=UPI0013EAF442|nr:MULTISPECIES: MarR family transcriptional regulator [unclassified Streptococcus]
MSGSIAIQLKKIVQDFENLSNRRLQAYQLTHSQFKIIKYLYRHQHPPINQGNVERYFSMSNPTVTGIVQNLEKKGWLRRQPDPTDSRSKLLILTEQSLAKEQEFNQLFMDMEEDLLAPLTVHERHALMALLTKLKPH